MHINRLDLVDNHVLCSFVNLDIAFSCSCRNSATVPDQALLIRGEEETTAAFEKEDCVLGGQRHCLIECSVLGFKFVTLGQLYLFLPPFADHCVLFSVQVPGDGLVRISPQGELISIKDADEVCTHEAYRLACGQVDLHWIALDLSVSRWHPSTDNIVFELEALTLQITE